MLFRLLFIATFAVPLLNLSFQSMCNRFHCTVRLLQLSDYDSSYAQQRVDVNAYNTKQQGVQARLQQQQQQYNYASAGNTTTVVMPSRDILRAGVM
jgi:hypothetical protein